MIGMQVFLRVLIVPFICSCETSTYGLVGAAGGVIVLVEGEAQSEATIQVKRVTYDLLSGQ